VLQGAVKKKAPKQNSTLIKKTVEKETPEKEIAEKEGVQNIDLQTIELIEATIEAICDDDGWAFLGDVGNLIVKKKPEFDPRNYGFTKLTPLLKSLTDILEIDERDSDKKGIKHVFVKLKFS
jgi:hypothetical protein